MALGLFAQIGLIAHLFSLLVPALGAQQRRAWRWAGHGDGHRRPHAASAGLMPAGADRRLVACAGYAVQARRLRRLHRSRPATNVPLLLLGVVLFGAGFGNATSLPPLIAQVEFVREDVVRVVALIVGISQGAYAFAPAAFGLIRELAPQAAGAASGAAPYLFAAAALAQGLAICAFLAGRTRR